VAKLNFTSVTARGLAETSSGQSIATTVDGDGRKEMPTKTKSFRLNTKADLDILAWLNDQPDQTKVVKRALRREMGVFIPDVLPENTRDVLGELVNEVRAMRNQIAQGVVAGGNGEVVDSDAEFDGVLGLIGV